MVWAFCSTCSGCCSIAVMGMWAAGADRPYLSSAVANWSALRLPVPAVSTSEYHALATAASVRSTSCAIWSRTVYSCRPIFFRWRADAASNGALLNSALLNPSHLQASRRLICIVLASLTVELSIRVLFTAASGNSLLSIQRGKYGKVHGSSGGTTEC